MVHVLVIVVASGVIVAMIAMLVVVAISMGGGISMVVVAVCGWLIGVHVPVPGRLAGVAVIESKLVRVGVGMAGRALFRRRFSHHGALPLAARPRAALTLIAPRGPEDQAAEL
jgi:hypothetical protein